MALKDEYLTISEAAKHLKVTRQTISRWIKEGKLPSERIGRQVLIRVDKFLNYYFGKTTDNLSDLLFMVLEVWIRVEFFNEYSSGDKFELSNISSDGIFEFAIIRKDGTKDIVKGEIRIGLTKKKGRQMPRFTIEKMWKETGERGIT